MVVSLGPQERSEERKAFVESVGELDRLVAQLALFTHPVTHAESWHLFFFRSLSHLDFMLLLVTSRRRRKGCRVKVRL
jgi:hypothetical protein